MPSGMSQAILKGDVALYPEGLLEKDMTLEELKTGTPKAISYLERACKATKVSIPGNPDVSYMVRTSFKSRNGTFLLYTHSKGQWKLLLSFSGEEYYFNKSKKPVADLYVTENYGGNELSTTRYEFENGQYKAKEAVKDQVEHQ